MNVLFAVSEAVPFVKSGGLGDVAGSLPQALKGEGADVRVILPKYLDIPPSFAENMTFIDSMTVQVGWRRQYCGLFELVHDGVTFYFVDNEYYFKRGGLYGYFDDAERFAFFNQAVLEACPRLAFRPDIIHGHDWQTGMIPVFLDAHYKNSEFHQGIKTVMTIHNLKYQGNFDASIRGELLNLGDEYRDRIDMNGGVGFLKAGLEMADAITTVSKTYAEEILHPFFGENLQALLSYRRGDLFGILNGIDVKSYDPMEDPHLFVPYRKSIRKKRKNKTALQEQLGLPVAEDVPMIGIISRMVQQKGFDLIAHVLHEMLQMDLQLVVLGAGEERYEELFRRAAERYPDRCSVHTKFDEPLARRIYAASDLFLMPSLFEPCGIGQMIAMRYKTLPIVRETGGLKDTVQPYNEHTGEGTGFTFTHYNAHEMLDAVRRALKVYRDPASWEGLIDNLSPLDFSWSRSAKQYMWLYGSLATEI